MSIPDRTRLETFESRLLLAGDPANTFQPPLAIPELGDVGQVVAKGDFNGDGYLDLAVTGGTMTTVGTGDGQRIEFDGGVQILLDDGTGQFARGGAPRELPFAPTAIVAGDFDGDAAADVAIGTDVTALVRNGGVYRVGTHPGGVFVLRGDGRGRLASPDRYAVNNSGTHSLVVGDFNGDGRLDIAAAGFRILSVDPAKGVTATESQITALRNAGNGFFFAGDETHIAGTARLSVAPVGYNLDGRTDLAVAGAGGIQFLQSKGDGTFDFPASWSGLGSLMSADLNGDGRLDLIGTTGSGGSVRYALARSKGGFGDLVTVPGTGGGSSVASELTLGDFDGDGRLDFLNGVTPQSTGGLFLQRADGSFAATPSTGITQPVLAGDFNNDGHDDAVTLNQVYLATPPAVFTTPRRTLVINGTRRADSLLVTVSGSRVVVTLNGETVSARLSRVRRIQITTGLGRDTVTVDPSVSAPTLISAGGESDTVTSGSGDDTIQGDNGSDVLSGGVGTDVLQGGRGSDTLDGGGGADAIYGGQEADTFAPGDALAELLDRARDEPHA